MIENDPMIVSKRRFMSALLVGGLIVVLVVLVGLVFPGLRRLVFRRSSGSSRARFSGVNHELRRIYLSVQSEIERRDFGDSNVVESALLELVDVYSVGYDCFRLFDSTGHVFIAINPDPALWQSPGGHQTEIAAYCPERLWNFRNGTTGFVAVYFGGTNTFLTNLPSWSPFPMEALMQREATGISKDGIRP